MAPPLKIAEFDIYYGKGIDQHGSVVDLALSLGILAQKGAWVFLDGENFAQGKENAINKLKNDLELYEKLKSRIEDETKPL